MINNEYWQKMTSGIVDELYGLTIKWKEKLMLSKLLRGDNGDDSWLYVQKKMDACNNDQ